VKECSPNCISWDPVSLLRRQANQAAEKAPDGILYVTGCTSMTSGNWSDAASSFPTLHIWLGMVGVYWEERQLSILLRELASRPNDVESA